MVLTEQYPDQGTDDESVDDLQRIALLVGRRAAEIGGPEQSREGKWGPLAFSTLVGGATSQPCRARLRGRPAGRSAAAAHLVAIGGR